MGGLDNELDDGIKLARIGWARIVRDEWPSPLCQMCTVTNGLGELEAWQVSSIDKFGASVTCIYQPSAITPSNIHYIVTAFHLNIHYSKYSKPTATTTNAEAKATNPAASAETFSDFSPLSTIRLLLLPVSGLYRLEYELAKFSSAE